MLEIANVRGSAGPGERCCLLRAFKPVRALYSVRVTNRVSCRCCLLFGRESKDRIYLWRTVGDRLGLVMISDGFASTPSMAAATARVHDPLQHVQGKTAIAGEKTCSEAPAYWMQFPLELEERPGAAVQWPGIAQIDHDIMLSEVQKQLLVRWSACLTENVAKLSEHSRLTFGCGMRPR